MMLMRILAAALFGVALLEVVMWTHTPAPLWLTIVRWVVLVSLFAQSMRLRQLR